MEKTGYVTIGKISDHLGIKEKTLYAMVSAGDIPHYRIGRLIRFKKDEIDAWMETRKVTKVSPDEMTDKILKSIRKPSINVDLVVKKVIDQTKSASYTLKNGKPDRIKDLRKEVHDGSL